jgi:hypothetical protein
MSNLFRLPDAVAEDPAVAAWFRGDNEGLRAIAGSWFGRIRALGPDVRELLHDHCPTACVGDAAFAYVGAYARHVSIGFFHGVDLPDPKGLLEGSGKRMRHVKLRWGDTLDEMAVAALIAAAYADVRARLDQSGVLSSGCS